MVINKFLILLLWLPISLFSQDRYFVSFKDKVNTPYSVSNPLQFLSQKSLDRRAKENFIINSEDLPVDPSYVMQVKSTGASVFFTSRWFNGVLIQANSTIAIAVSALPFVTKVALVAPGTKLIGGRKKTVDKSERVDATSVLKNQWQNEMIGLDKMQTAGYRGEGIDVAVFDDGFMGVDTLSSFRSIFEEGRMKSVFDFVHNSKNVYSEFDHGTGVFSIIAGNISNTFVGGASKANFFLYRTEDNTSEYRIEEYNWLFAAERADSIGVDVINSSLGYYTFDDPTMNYTNKDLDGKTSVVSRAAHKAAERGIVVVASAGNEGSNSWKYITMPADAEGVIASGAVNNVGYRSLFSSFGPSADGRIKPDVAAMGEVDALIRYYGTIEYGNGTSYASPLVASLVIGLRQAIPQASAKEIYQRVISSASQFNKPDDQLGYGIPNFTLAKDLSDDFHVYPNPISDGLLKILFSYPHDQNFSVTIFNSTGQKVFELSDSVSPDNNPYAIDLTEFASGLYLVKVQMATSTKMMRIVSIKN